MSFANSKVFLALASLSSLAAGEISFLQSHVKTKLAAQQSSQKKRSGPHMQWHLNKPATVITNNLGGHGPGTGNPEIRIENVSVLHGWQEGHALSEAEPNHSWTEPIFLDLLIRPASDYQDNVHTYLNGAMGDFAKIYVRTKRTETFRFSFVRKGTVNEEWVIPEFDFTIFDIDQPGPDNYCAEMVTGWLVEHYATLSNAYHHVLGEFEDRVQVCSNVTINNGEVQNPTQIRTLSNAQARASIMFSFRNTSFFHLSLTNDADSPRPLVFAGTSHALEPPSGSWHEHFLPVDDVLENGYSRDFEWILYLPAEVTANNLGHRGPNFTDPPEIRYRSVGILTTFDENNELHEKVMLDLVLYTEDPYWASDHIITEWNGANGEFGEVGLSRQSNVTLIYTFVETDTYKPKVVPWFEFTLFDIDNQLDPNLGEEYTVHGAHSYSTVDGAFTIIDDSVPNQVHLKSWVTILKGAIQNPTSLDALNENMYKCSVQFTFKETSHWEVDFVTTAHTERALVFGAHPRPKINDTTVILPTLAPTPAPTSPVSTVFGDPHIQNMRGDKFDILRPATYAFLAIPRGAGGGGGGGGGAHLKILGQVTARGDPCAGQLYLTGLTITGHWLGNLSRLELSTKGEMLDADESHELRVGDAEGGGPPLSVDEFAGRLPPRMAKVTRFHPDQPESLNKHVTTLLVRLFLGPTILKVTFEHQKEKTGFSNSLMLLTYGLAAVDGEVGGLLGRDNESSTVVAQDSDECDQGRQRVPRLKSCVRAIAYLFGEGEEELQG